MTQFECRDLCKKYGHRNNTINALLDVSLKLEQGRIYGLVGNNGAGKTTFMRLIAGLVWPSAGTMSLFGASKPSEMQKARQMLGSLISEPCGYEDLSVWQNLKAQDILIPRELKSDLSATCELVGLRHETLRRSLRQCSSGEKQRYGLAAALLGSPKLLLLDEPMNGLDPSGVIEVRELLLRLNREYGLTILVSSHILTELHKIATEYIFLRFGRVLETISSAELDNKVKENQYKDVEAYFIALNQAAQSKESKLLNRSER